MATQREIIEAKIDIAIEAAINKKTPKYALKIIDLRKQILSIPELEALLEVNDERTR